MSDEMSDAPRDRAAERWKRIEQFLKIHDVTQNVDAWPLGVLADTCAMIRENFVCFCEGSMENPPFERHSRIYLFLSLCLFLLIPFLHQCVRTSLISNVPNTDGLGIAGHIEWFDLINETIQAFLVVPLYHLLNTVKDEPGVWKRRIHCSFAVSTALYAAFSNIVINLFAGLICIALVECSGSRAARSSADGSGWLLQWAKIGAFSGAQILLDNLIYALIVCKMVNDVAEQGNYMVSSFPGMKRCLQSAYRKFSPFVRIISA